MSLSDPSPNRLLQEPLRTAVERCVTSHLGRPWRAERCQDHTNDASHPTAVLSDGRFAAFVKFGDKPFVLDQFQQEAAGLRMLTRLAGVLTPEVIDVVSVEGGAFEVLQALEPVPREGSQWRDIGRTLAQVHRVAGEHFGLETHSYWGDLHQDNTPSADWVSFYRDRRLLPWLAMANASGHLPVEVALMVDRVVPRLSDLAGPPVCPRLLHGDAHVNNWISTVQGAALIDPAVHFGHPELDLAYLDLFLPIPDDILDGYREVAAVDSGFARRKHLWRIAGWLGAIAVGGRDWVSRLVEAVKACTWVAG